VVCILRSIDSITEEVLRNALLDSRLLQAIERLDLYRRYSYRINALKRVLERINTRILLFKPLPSELCSFSDRFILAEPMESSKLAKLIGDSKYLLDIQIPGQTGVHQRAKAALSLGTGLITNGPLIDRNDYREYFWAHDDCLDQMYHSDFSSEWAIKTESASQLTELFSTERFSNDVLNFLTSLY
jgi:hypothetical protein